MKDIITSIYESNITKEERSYRDFCGLLRGKNIDINNIKICKTTKGNWAVYNGEGKKVCLVSNYILTPEIIEKYNIETC